VANSERRARGLKLKHVSEKRDVDVSGFRPSKILSFSRHPTSSVTFNEFEDFRNPSSRPVRQNRGHLRGPVYQSFCHARIRFS